MFLSIPPKPSFPTHSLYMAPPPFPTLTIQWVMSMAFYAFAWSLGWIGAIFLYVAEVIDYYVMIPIAYAIDGFFSGFNSILSTFENVSRFAGPFGIDVASFLMGILLLFLILGAYLIIKGLAALIGAL
jgi:hypothetical protein